MLELKTKADLQRLVDEGLEESLTHLGRRQSSGLIAGSGLEIMRCVSVYLITTRMIAERPGYSWMEYEHSGNVQRIRLYRRCNFAVRNCFTQSCSVG